ncbi:MAG: sulfurtransferase-like selenium metabolism protein YedF [Chloroflexi bacterium]|nr:sulfurtransferase-like selenium metabolism protein YedF [Chloroflexota bacterium]
MASSSNRERTVLILNSDHLGRGDEELGTLLIDNFLRTLAFLDTPPQEIVCYNSGVKLAAAGSTAVPFLEALAKKGADIVLCGTCVHYFGLEERIVVGRIGDMRGIVNIVMEASKTITV